MYHETCCRYDAGMETTLLWILAIGLMLLGFAGTIAPALPGIPLLLLGMLVAAWIDGFTRIGVATLVVLGALTLVSIAVEFAAASLGAQRVGASRKAITGAAIGTAAGLFFGIFGLVIGPFAGAAIGELLAHRDPARAVGVGIASWIGFAVGAVVKVALAFTMIGVFIAAYLID